VTKTLVRPRGGRMLSTGAPPPRFTAHPSRPPLDDRSRF